MLIQERLHPARPKRAPFVPARKRREEKQAGQRKDADWHDSAHE
jgi:hypothetical protein